VRFARSLLSGLAVVPRILVLDGWRALLRLLAWLLAVWARVVRKFGKRPSLLDSGRRPWTANCVPMSHPAFKVPDPLIYSQEYFARLGLAVTWDNPDIVLRRGGVVVPSYGLQPDTEYEIVARIWNNSFDAPVVDLPVSFSYLAFGIGTQSYPITPANQPVHVTLGVKGGPNHPAFATAIWRTPAAPGHYCIQVRLEPASDANYANNLGQENTQVGPAQSPAAFAFLLRNDTGKADTVHFEVDTYTIPEPPPCGPSGTAAFNPRTHATAIYPVPPGWTVQISPDHPLLQAQQEQEINVMITPPPGFKGTKAFNINAYTASVFLGGVTLYVQAS